MRKVAAGFVAGILVALAAESSAQKNFGFMSTSEFLSALNTTRNVPLARLNEARLIGYVTGASDGLEAAMILLFQDGKTEAAKRLAVTAQCVALRGNRNVGALFENVKAIVRAHSTRDDNVAAVIFERACVP